MTQNRQSHSNARLSEREWDENPNRNNDQGYRSQGGKYDDDTQRNAQGASPRWNRSSGFTDDSGTTGYNESDYNQRSNYYGRGYGATGNYNPGDRFSENQGRNNDYNNLDFNRVDRGRYLGRSFEEDARRSNAGYENTSHSMYGNNSGQGQYGSQPDRNYGATQNRESWMDNNRQGNYGMNTDRGMGNANSGSQGWNNDGNEGSMGINRQGSLSGTHKGKGPKGYHRSDDRIREDISDRLSDDAHIDASDIEVAVDNGVVSLSGTVDNREIKRRAEDLAESISGVANVENRLSVHKDNLNETKTGQVAGNIGNTNSSDHRGKRNSYAPTHAS